MTDTDDPTMSDYGVNDLYLKVLRAANFPHAADEIDALRAEVERLQAIVTDLANYDPAFDCEFCEGSFEDHEPSCVVLAARAVSPTPTEGP